MSDFALMSDFAPGMEVMLKSGGPRMTVRFHVTQVASLAELGVHCDWFGEEGVLAQRAVFLPEQLRRLIA